MLGPEQCAGLSEESIAIVRRAGGAQASRGFRIVELVATTRNNGDGMKRGIQELVAGQAQFQITLAVLRIGNRIWIRSGERQRSVSSGAAIELDSELDSAPC